MLLWGAAQGRGPSSLLCPWMPGKDFGRETLQGRVGQVAGYFSTGPGGPSYLDLLTLFPMGCAPVPVLAVGCPFCHLLLPVLEHTRSALIFASAPLSCALPTPQGFSPHTVRPRFLSDWLICLLPFSTFLLHHLVSTSALSRTSGV